MISEWWWLDDNDIYQPFDRSISVYLEMAYMANKGKVFFDIGELNYEANISDKTTMWQTNNKTGNTRWIQRTSTVKRQRIQVNTDDDSDVSGKNHTFVRTYVRMYVYVCMYVCM